MTKKYKFPLLSTIAYWVYRALPERVLAWVWLSTLEHLTDKHTQPMEMHDDDGITFLYAVSDVTIENIKHKIAEDTLRGDLV